MLYGTIAFTIYFVLSDGIHSLPLQDSFRQSAGNEVPHLTANCIVRKEFTYMPLEERMRFINAYKKMSIEEPFKSGYEELILTHPTLASHIHIKAQFFPWHRLFLLKFEKLLQEIDPRVTLPYWDWSLSHQSPWRSSTLDIWTSLPWGLGGNGDNVTHCVTTGPFASDKWKAASPDGKRRCLRRNFNGIFPGIFTIHRALRFHPEEFTQFEDYVRNFIHDVIHWRIGGTMGDKFGSLAPEFILHHTFLDKIWADFQKQSLAHKWAYFKGTTHNIYHTNIPATHMVDVDNLNGVKVCYKDPFESYGSVHKKLGEFDLAKIRSLMTKKAYTFPYFTSYMKY